MPDLTQFKRLHIRAKTEADKERVYNRAMRTLIMTDKARFIKWIGIRAERMKSKY